MSYSARALSENELARKSLAGDEAAFEELVGRMTPVLLRFFSRKAAESPQELANEAWRSVVEGFRELRPGSPFTARLLASAYRVWLRSVPNTDGRGLPAAMLRPSLLQDVASDEGRLTASLVALQACLDRLTADERQILGMRYWQGMTLAEIAESMQRVSSPIRAKASRAGIKLQRCMASKGFAWTTASSHAEPWGAIQDFNLLELAAECLAFRELAGDRVGREASAEVVDAAMDAFRLAREQALKTEQGTTSHAHSTEIRGFSAVLQEVVSGGPYAGRRFRLSSTTTTIGRHPSNHVVLSEAAEVSRQHAVISLQDGIYFLRDTGSRNGTFLRGARLDPDQSYPLRHDDRIRFVETEFIFQHAAGRPVHPPVEPPVRSRGAVVQEVVLVDDEVPSESTATFLKMDVNRHAEDWKPVSATQEARWEALVGIMRDLVGALVLDEVLPRVLDNLFKIFPQADRGFIVLREDDGTLVPRWFHVRSSVRAASLRVSRSIIRYVVGRQEAILSQDVTADERLNLSDSVTEPRMRSMMCAPLLDSSGNALGVIQIDTLDQPQRFQPADLQALVGVAIQAGMAIENAQVHERALKQMEMEQDLRLAEEVQRAFLPRRRPDLAGYVFHDHYRAAHHIGGDYFDYVALPDGRTAILVADVAGHTVAAAMLMAKLSAEARFCLASSPHPATAIAQLNDHLCEMQNERFITMLMVVLDPLRHSATIVNAGHIAPFWRRRDGRLERPGTALGGLPLGILKSVQFRSIAIDLEPGDLLVMYTDGIPDAQNAQSQTFTIDRVGQHVRLNSHPEAIVESLLTDWRGHLADEPQLDDICLVCLQRQPQPTES